LGLLVSVLLVGLFSCSKTSIETLACDTSTPSLYRLNNPSHHIILVMGQSNTHSGIGFNSLLDTISQGVMQLGRFGKDNLKVIPATLPLQHYTARKNRIGFGVSFANLYKNEFLKTTDTIIMVPCGFGGTGFSDNQWNPGDELYNDALSRVTYLLEQYPNSKLQAVLWHQGENDVGQKNYENQLRTFMSSLRKDVNAPNVPIVLGGMVPFWVEKNTDRITLQNLIQEIANTTCATGYADPYLPFIIEKTENTSDTIHFDAQGQRILGIRYFEEYKQLILKP